MPAADVLKVLVVVHHMWDWLWFITASTDTKGPDDHREANAPMSVYG